PFDIFSAGFYLLTRCEEYNSKSKDEHGRFLSFASMAFQHSFLDQPVINLWALDLRKKLQDKYPLLPCKTFSFRSVVTIDVDQAFAIRARGWVRTLGRLGKQLLSLQLNKIMETASVLLLNRKDPFDTFDYILTQQQKYDHELFFFIHLGDYDTFDKSIAWNHFLMKKLMQKLSASALMGIHPSYRSNDDLKTLEEECERYGLLFHTKPKRSRQHYLKMQLPETYENLMNMGISEDYTMGYAEQTGFRAGTCTPFYFYNLEKECETPLKVYPFVVMDRTLKDGLKLNVARSIEEIKEIRNKVKSVEGTFILLFHNETLSENSEWIGWREVYESILQQ
ncbi:MAG TPA: polysaccharide deacetylase family protein, partial [Cytophagaceae bacterium]|nr:polysaccharide deacetylase family protein [Cytophagaceae bacterium]